MRKQKVLYLMLVFVFFALGSKSYSQITANPTHGCAPLNVLFTGPAGASSPSWTFGVGGGTSLLQSPSNIYTSPGTYNVTYTAMVGGSPVSYNTQVTVNPNPTGNISFVQPTSHCAPMTVTFTGSGGSPGSTYGWSFGDLTPGSGSSTTHAYTTGDTFYPSLTFTDAATGCVGQATAGAINVSTPLSIHLSANPGISACTAPFITSFAASGTSGSPLTNIINYNWTFGNGTAPFNQANTPNITYAQQGQYTVTLTGTDDNNCSTTVTTQVSVTQPSITATLPGTVCIGLPFLVTINSTQINSVWDMGDGTALQSVTVSSVNTPITNTIYIYYAPGPKIITYAVTSGTCTDSHTLSVFVEAVTASLTAVPSFTTCNPTMVATYTDLSSSNTSASVTTAWSTFWYPVSAPASDDHASPLSTSGPSATFTFWQGSLNPYTIYNTFSPIISITVTSSSAAQCVGSFTTTLNSIVRPTAFFNKDKKEGCAPLVVTLRDSSFTNIAYPVTSYTWSDGASPPHAFPFTITPPATISPITFTYSSPGTYTPFLSIQTASGCTDVSFVDTIVVVGPPTPSATFPTTVCAGQPLQFHLTASPTQSTISHWHVATDNNFFSGCVSDSAPSFLFTHVGIQNVTVTAYQNSCPGTTVMPQNITVLGPFGKSTFTTNCTNPTQVAFSSFLQDVQTATLNFGDGTSTVITGAPNSVLSYSTLHTYTPTGTGGLNYTVTLSSQNSANAGCATHIYTMEVKVRLLQPSIYANGSATFPVLPAPLICTNHQVTFDASNSVDVYSGCARGYAWFLNSPVTPTSTPPTEGSIPLNVMSFATPGIYTITLKVKDENDCQASLSQAFRVSSANPTFAFVKNPICLSDNPVELLNSTVSTILNPDPNISFSFYFGDGTLPYTTTNVSDTIRHSYNPFSVQPPSNTFFVVATATNNFGCVNSITHTIMVSNPSASFSASSYSPCIPEVVTFTCPPPTYNSYDISYGDLTPPVSTANSIFSHNYTTSGIHNVILTVTDQAQCKNSSTITLNALVTPMASFTTVGAANFCAPATITFSSTSSTSDPQNSPITNYIWQIDTVTYSNNTSTAIKVFQTGLWQITLTVSPGQGVCQDTAVRFIYVYDTHATLALNKTKFCIGDTIVAHLSPTGLHDASSWIVNVGFGIQPSATAVSPFQSLSYTYTNSVQSGTASVVATVNSPNDACVISTNPILIEIVKLNPDFLRNQEQSVLDSVHCLRLQDVFTHTTNITIDPLTYNWDFGDGSTTTAPNPVYTYTVPGVYPIHLTVKDNAVGCVASSVKNLTVNALPTASISGGNFCPNTNFPIIGIGSTGVITGTWSPAQSLITSPVFTTSSGHFTATATSSTNTSFSLTVTDASGCVSDIVTDTVSIQPSAKALTLDTSVVIGQPIPINIYAGSNGFTYTWTPLVTDLSCPNCFNPTSTSTVNITYTVQIADTLGCGHVQSTYKIIIEPLTSLDVPTAFTPNGDGVNDIVYVGGWGIRKLNYFKIFNRWGELLFESNDLKTGWDGYFAGVPQNMETYVYQVSVLTYLDEKPVLKSGTVKIIR